MFQLARLALGKTILIFCCVAVVGASTSFAQVVAPSDGGNPFLHAIGWQTFENAGTFQDQDNGFASINPVDVLTAPSLP